jgi:hypothetical protein
MYTILLTGAALIGVPILLHLIMRQEPKKLPFPAFRFLKMKRRINQRKMRLRHFILLAMRMFLIALICLALFSQSDDGRRSLLSDRLNIKGEQPIACVLVIDTSPSMSYVLSVDRNGLSEARKRGPALLEEESAGRSWTALDESRFRAMELIDELPPGSKVAVVDTADRDGFWSLALPEARKKIRDMKKTKASSRSVTQALLLAYQLFAKVEQEAAPGQESMPRLLAVFSDRTVPSWDASQIPFLEEMKNNVLQEMRKNSPKADIVSTYVDVGVDKPHNLAITSIEMKQQVIPANAPIAFTVLLDAVGARQDNVVEVRFSDDPKLVLTRAVRVDPGETKEVAFERENLAPGLYQATVTLKTADAVPFDDVRYFSFRVREPRKILVVADAPPTASQAALGVAAPLARLRDATQLWRITLKWASWYSCDLMPTDAFLEAKLSVLSKYEAVIFAGLVQPSPDLWDKATLYVEGGGKLVVDPGGSELLVDGRDKPPPGYDNHNNKLLPGAFKKWIVVDRFKPGVTWTWNALKAHPLLNDFRNWVQNPYVGDKQIDFIANRPQAWGYWEVTPRDKIDVIVSYADSDDADTRRPALLEKQVGKTGRVLLFTTPMDGKYRAGANLKTDPDLLNDYAATSFQLVLVSNAFRYLIGAIEDEVLNYPNGQSVRLKFPLDAAARSKTYYLSGPDLSDKESEIIRGETETTVTLGPDRLKSAGNYSLQSDPSDKKPELKPWRDGFSLNPPAEESNLERLPVEQIEALFGPHSVVATDKERKLHDILGEKFSAPIELFPFLMILLLLFLAFENLLSNKFYRQPAPKEGGN